MSTQRCPYCQQAIRDPAEPPKPRRVCYDCGNPILRGHRYTFQPRKGIETAVVHRVCSNPTSYYRAAECKRIGVVGYKDLSWDEIDKMTAQEDELEKQFAEWRVQVGRV